MKHVPQLQLSDEEFDRLNEAASQANLGMYDYILLTLVGRPPAGKRPPVWPPVVETKADGAEVEPATDGSAPSKARARRG